MFPYLQEGDLSTYRAAIVNNKQLERLGKVLFTGYVAKYILIQMPY